MTELDGYLLKTLATILVIGTAVLYLSGCANSKFGEEAIVPPGVAPICLFLCTTITTKDVVEGQPNLTNLTKSSTQSNTQTTGAKTVNPR